MITVKDIVLPINNGVLSSQDLVIILELTANNLKIIRIEFDKLYTCRNIK